MPQPPVRTPTVTMPSSAEGSRPSRLAALCRSANRSLSKNCWADPTRPFYDDTPGSGHPVRYDAPPEDDALLAACRMGAGR